MAQDKNNATVSIQVKGTDIQVIYNLTPVKKSNAGALGSEYKREKNSETYWGAKPSITSWSWSYSQAPAVLQLISQKPSKIPGASTWRLESAQIRIRSHKDIKRKLTGRESREYDTEYYLGGWTRDGTPQDPVSWTRPGDRPHKPSTKRQLPSAEKGGQSSLGQSLTTRTVPGA